MNWLEKNYEAPTKDQLVAYQTYEELMNSECECYCIKQDSKETLCIQGLELPVYVTVMEECNRCREINRLWNLIDPNDVQSAYT